MKAFEGIVLALLIAILVLMVYAKFVKKEPFKKPYETTDPDGEGDWGTDTDEDNDY